MTNATDLYLTDIVLSEKIMYDIQELSPNSAAGPDGIPSSLLVNCARDLAPFLLIIFTHSLSSDVVPLVLNELELLLSLNPATGQSRVIRKQVSSFIDKKGCINS